VIGAVAIALLITGGDDGPVAAADAAPRITFDGTSCRYNGPTLIEQGTMEVTAVNTTTQPVDVGGFLMLESRLAAELERTPLGTDMALTPTDPMPTGDFYLITAPAGSEGVGLWPITAGTHIIDCVTYPSAGGAPEHVWRAASTIEVVAP
ncbi:MAG: hypothetical protein HKN80_01755, partial [Acidimicrobiia bacterium]|nr:hypothetical protein [Acidimicrobiia bacterium]